MKCSKQKKRQRQMLKAFNSSIIQEIIYICENPGSQRAWGKRRLACRKSFAHQYPCLSLLPVSTHLYSIFQFLLRLNIEILNVAEATLATWWHQVKLSRFYFTPLESTFMVKVSSYLIPPHYLHTVIHFVCFLSPPLLCHSCTLSLCNLELHALHAPCSQNSAQPCLRISSDKRNIVIQIKNRLIKG